MAGRDGYVLSYDPDTRIRTRVHDAEGMAKQDTPLGSIGADRRPEREGSQAVIQVHEQDLGPLLRHMEKRRSEASSWRPATSGQKGPSGLQFVGRIPNIWLPFLNRSGILHNPQALREFMDSDVMKRFRANTVVLSRKGMKRKYGRRRS